MYKTTFNYKTSKSLKPPTLKNCFVTRLFIGVEYCWFSFFIREIQPKNHFPVNNLFWDWTQQWVCRGAIPDWNEKENMFILVISASCQNVTGDCEGKYKNANELRWNLMPFNQFSLAQLDGEKMSKKKKRSSARLWPSGIETFPYPPSPEV